MTQTNSQMMALKADGKGGGAHNTAGEPAIEDHAAWPMISRLPVMLGVTIPVRGFKVRDLLSLRVEQTVSSSWAVTKDVPLEVGKLHLCWGEFEIADQRLALRLTRLA
ncbi:MAG TPA: FliM/FliN family flagellar motor switch protein [Acidobacteriaceae bacterium]|nr:FliM/FliN family flagellar motor switch protein [Acidobacteriaceae bacterium]